MKLMLLLKTPNSLLMINQNFLFVKQQPKFFLKKIILENSCDNKKIEWKRETKKIELTKKETQKTSVF